MNEPFEISVRFHKSDKRSLWRVFGVVNSSRLRFLFDQMMVFNEHQNIVKSVVDFSEVTQPIDEHSVARLMGKLTGGRKHSSRQQLHYVFPPQSIGLADGCQQ